MTTAATIAEGVSAMKAAIASQPPNEVINALSREQADLAVRGIPDRVMSSGSMLPDADLLEVHGAQTTLYEVTDGRPAVIVFYRGAWCPYCNLALSIYQAQLLPELTRRGVGLIAVSPQTPDESLSMREKNELAFPVLSDPGNTLARHLGIVSAPSSEAREAQLQLGLDLTSVNADGTIAIPMPTALLIDGTHVLRWIDVHPDYSTRTEPAEILAAIHDAGL
jgi:peroxiredoxin